MRKVLLLCLTVSALILSCGCTNRVKMPFNGDISFHQMAITVPERFIRDSTQSKEDLWVFEHGNYSEYVLLSRKDASGDAKMGLEAYVESMKEVEADSKIITFLGGDAVHTTYTRDGVFCQEMLFPYEGSYYAVSLRGGTEEAFREICDSVALLKNTEQTTA